MKRVRGKKLVWIPMVLMILFGTMAFIGPAFAQQGTIALNPASITWTNPPHNGGPADIFTVQVNITDVTNMIMCVFSLQWDPTVIQLTAVAKGNVLEPALIFKVTSLPPSAGGLAGNPNNILGEVTYVEDISGGAPPITLPPGTWGLVATLTFKQITTVPGHSDINFTVTPPDPYTTTWMDSVGTYYSFVNMVKGSFTLVYPPPSPPTAAFTWTPTSPYDGSPASFDASASTGGFDGDTNTLITNYHWDWGDTHSEDHAAPTATATHTFSPDGTYTVTLTVTAPGIGWIDPAYVDHASVAHPITVLKKIVGRNIDLTTENTRSAYKTSSPWMKMVTTPVIGTGPNMPADAFGPQENVTLYANVTYNLCPVANKPVDFEIHSPTDNWVIFRQAFTDQSGIATITFRIPWPNTDGPAVVFGTWHAYASCDIADMKVYDTLDFKVGWIIDKTVTIDKPIPGVYHRGIDSIVTTETITNIGMIPRDVVITVTLYDELGFAVNYATITAVIPPGTTTNYQITIFVPKYTVCGIGTLYMNIYGALPTQCGVSYCPENTVNFQVAC